MSYLMFFFIILILTMVQENVHGEAFSEVLQFDVFENMHLEFPNSTNITQLTTQVATQMSCIQDCYDTSWCISNNFKKFSELNGRHLCELLSSDSVTYQNVLEHNKKYDHYSIKNPCKTRNILCANGGLCTFHKNRYDHICHCKAGFHGDLCQQDIDECNVTGASPGLCPINAHCKNVIGSFVCECNHGYTGDGKNCSDIDECVTAQPCGKGTCVNTVGSYKCLCITGSVFDGKLCTKYPSNGLGASSILNNFGNATYIQTILGYLSSVRTYTDTYWVRCWDAKTDGFDAVTVFKKQCKDKKPTLIIVHVSPLYIFGGFTDKSWGPIMNNWKWSNVSFINSLYNIKGFQPFKLKILDPNKAINTDPSIGPLFGDGDLRLARNAGLKTESLTVPTSYEKPPGCSGGCLNIMAGSNGFRAANVEAFYEVDGNNF